MTVKQRQELRDRLINLGLSRNQADTVSFYMKKHDLPIVTKGELENLEGIGIRAREILEKTELVF